MCEIGPRSWKYTRYKPTRINAAKLTMYKYVGGAKSAPDSRTPRRFANVISAMNATHIHTRYGAKSLNAEMIAATPPETETATVRM